MGVTLQQLSPEEYRKRRVENIKRQLPMARVLLHYGVELRYPNPTQETAYSCPLHGDGTDSSPSARVYPETETTYCFACQKVRDAVGWVREKEGLPFWAALKRLEELFDLEPLPSHISMLREASGVHSEDGEGASKGPTLEQQLQGYFSQAEEEPPEAVRGPDFSGAEERARLTLLMLTRGLPPDKRLKAWGVWWAARAASELAMTEEGARRSGEVLKSLFLKLRAQGAAPRIQEERADPALDEEGERD
jgi:hypothetical protein